MSASDVTTATAGGCQGCQEGSLSTGQAITQHSALPINPFTALRARYGMLLGQDDFQALIGYPRGKLMLHNAWLHGSGVIQGFRVSVDADHAAGTYTLRVGQGLALDGVGRELHLDGDWCRDLATWAAGLDPSWPSKDTGCDGERTIDAFIRVHLELCTAAPVPALSDPCDLSRRHTSDSRVLERVMITLEPAAVDPDRPEAYHRVRVLLGLDRAGATDLPGQQAAELAELVAAVPDQERAPALLAAFRELAALDAADLTPWAAEGDLPTLFPSPDSTSVELARLTLTVQGYGTTLRVTDYEIGLCGRPTLVPTATLFDLLHGVAPALIGAAGAQDAGGPRVERDVEWPAADVLRLRVTQPLHLGSLTDHPVLVTSLSDRGWVREDIARIEHDPAELTLDVALHEPPAYRVVRIIVRGTGPTPVCGADTLIPLAGLAGGPPGTADDGHDAVLTVRATAAQTHGPKGDAT
jgi:hypothetical protein